MAYNKTVWQDDSSPYLNAANLNKMENGIEAANRIVPENTGTTGQVMTKTPTGTQWTDAGNPTDAQVAGAVGDWLDDNITPTSPVVDETLSISGAAADAQKTGQEISDLKSAIDAKTGLPEGFGTALMELVNHIGMWTDGNAQRYIDNLQNTLDGGGGDVADLSYITAVYTQSGTVYDTDSLSSLRSDLVVTAHYTDSTTAVVTAYTLSGTLTEGTSTITVAYGGKTTTFNVTVTADPFPTSTYQKVEWVGSDTPHIYGPRIDTGIEATSKAELNGYSVEITAQWTTLPTGGYSASTGMVVATSGNAGCYFGAINDGRIALTGSASAIALPNDISANDVNTYIISWSTTAGTLTCGGHTISRDFNNPTDSSSQILRFGVGAGGGSNGAGAEGVRIYNSVIIRKDSVIIANYYPCYRKADGVIGFYDTVNKVFKENSGVGAFIKGADI